MGVNKYTIIHRIGTLTDVYLCERVTIVYCRSCEIQVWFVYFCNQNKNPKLPL